jgi:hypothetical protein
MNSIELTDYAESKRVAKNLFKELFKGHEEMDVDYDNLSYLIGMIGVVALNKPKHKIVPKMIIPEGVLTETVAHHPV